MRLPLAATTAKTDHAGLRTARQDTPPRIDGVDIPSAMSCDTCAATQDALVWIPQVRGRSYATYRVVWATRLAESFLYSKRQHTKSPTSVFGRPPEAGGVCRTTLLAPTASGESPCKSTAESLPALAVSPEESVLFLMLPSILLLRPFMDFILGGGALCGGETI